MLIYKSEELKELLDSDVPLKDSVVSLQQRIEKSQTLCNVDCFYGQNVYKWRRFNHHRLLGHMVHLDLPKQKQDLLFLLEIFIRSDKRYEIITDNSASMEQWLAGYEKEMHRVCEQIRSHYIQKTDPERIVDEDLRHIATLFQGKNGPPPLKPLPDEWHQFLQSDWHACRNECPIYESFQWRQKVIDFDPDRINLLFQKLTALVDTVENCHSIFPTIEHVKLQTMLIDGWTIYYWVCRPQEQIVRWQWLIVLWDLLPPDTSDASVNAKFKEFTSNIQRNNQLDTLSQYCQTAYPALLLFDKDNWKSMETNPHPSLALSAEEIRLLSTFSGFSNLPSLIEGRAGSGKSTLLFYVMAESVSSWLKTLNEMSRNNTVPAAQLSQLTDKVKTLFITQSDRLLRNARETISSLISAGTNVFGGRLDTAREECSYRTLYELLDRELRDHGHTRRFANRSQTGGYVNMARFRRLYYGRRLPVFHTEEDYVFPQYNIQVTISSELAWFVIRTYIKGRAMFNPESGQLEWLDPESYKELPKKDRHVTPDVYRQVYEQVWQNWYQPLTTDDSDGWPPCWDDQDLALECLAVMHQRMESLESSDMISAEKIPAAYSLIVCDEAQDFTRIETDVLMYFFAYRYYDLRSLYPLKLPLLVAADPFQTINPSGFRWEGVKDLLINALHSSNTTSRRIEIQHQELQNNYRNAPPIARLANMIQAYRHWREDEKESPQIIFKTDPENQNTVGYLKYDLNHASDTASLIQKIISADIEILVPYKEADVPIVSQLKEHSQEDLLVTAMEMKGLERDIIIIAGFGDYFLRTFGIHNAPQNDRLSFERCIQRVSDEYELAYYFDNLYVAITRAKQELVILDSSNAIEFFWNSFFKYVQINLSPASSQFTWEEYYQCEFHDYDIDGLSGGDPVVKARDWRDKGQANQDAEDLARAEYWFDRAIRRYSMDQAHQHYPMSVLTLERNECRAWKHYFQGRYRDAGLCLRDNANKPKEALEWFWHGAVWEDLIETLNRYPHRFPNWDNRQILCRLPMSQKTVDTSQLSRSFTDSVEEFLNAFEMEEKQRNMSQGSGPDRHPWNELIRLFISQSAKHREMIPSDTLLKILQLGIRMRKVFTITIRELAELAYQCKEIDLAIELFEAAGIKDDTRYHEMVAPRKPYPDNLMHWENAGKLNRVIASFQAVIGNRSEDQVWIDLAPENRRRVTRAFSQLKHDHSDDFIRIMVHHAVMGEYASIPKHFFEAIKRDTTPVILITALIDRLQNINAIMETSSDRTPISIDRKTTFQLWWISKEISAAQPDESLRESKQLAGLLLAIAPNFERLWDFLEPREENIRNERDREEKMEYTRWIIPVILKQIMTHSDHIPLEKLESVLTVALGVVWKKEETPDGDANDELDPMEADDDYLDRKDRPGHTIMAELRPIYENWKPNHRSIAILNSLRSAIQLLECRDDLRFEKHTWRRVKSISLLLARYRRSSPGMESSWQTQALDEAIASDWTLVGRFIESTKFHLHAIWYYESLLSQLPDGEQKESVRKCFQEAEKRKRQHDFLKNDFFLKPGKCYEDDNFAIRLLGNGKTLTVEDVIDGYRCQFHLDTGKIRNDPRYQLIFTKRMEDYSTGRMEFSENDRGESKISMDFEYVRTRGYFRIRLPSGKWIRTILP